MGLLDSILGGAEGQQDYHGFVNRYEQGRPEDGYSGEEVLNRYQEIAPTLPQSQYEQAAIQAVARLSPQQRQDFAEYLFNQARQQNVVLPSSIHFQGAQQYQNPGLLAGLLGQVHEQQPGLLVQLLGGSPSGSVPNQAGILDNPMAKAVLAGIAAFAVKKMLSGHQAA